MKEETNKDSIKKNQKKCQNRLNTAAAFFILYLVVVAPRIFAFLTTKISTLGSILINLIIIIIFVFWIIDANNKCKNGLS